MSGVLVAAALGTELLFVRGFPRVRTGIGPGARERLLRALERIRPRAALVLGFCGAARASLAPGELVLAIAIRRGKEEITLPKELLAAARERLPGAQAGPVATVEGVVGPAGKARLSLDALAVDMESYHLAEVLLERGISFLVVRCVLDRLWEELSGRGRWAPRALGCARRLGAAARALVPLLEEI